MSLNLIQSQITRQIITFYCLKCHLSFHSHLGRQSAIYSALLLLVSLHPNPACYHTPSPALLLSVHQGVHLCYDPARIKVAGRHPPDGDILLPLASRLHHQLLDPCSCTEAE